MSNVSDIIQRGATGARPAVGAVPIGSLFYDTTLNKFERNTGAAWEDCEPVGTGGDVTFAGLLASQLVNEIKGWPPIVNTGDLDALNLWWDKVGTPTTAPSVTDTSVAGLTDDYELCLKVVTDAASEGLSQRFTFADEPRVKAGRTVSALLAIWSVGSVSVTAKLVNSDASETAAAAVTAAAWTIVEIPAHVLAGTYVDLKVTAGAAGTFYVVPLGMNIGSRGFPLPPRPVRYVDKTTSALVNADPGGAGYASLSLQASSSKLTCFGQISIDYNNNTTLNKSVTVRRLGDTYDNYANAVVRNAAVSVGYTRGSRWVACDDAQNVEWKSDAAAGDSEVVIIHLTGYQEWA